jgi:hypothetical protein
MGMIPVLFSSPGIASCRLDVAIHRGTNPHFSPGRRNGQAFDSSESFGVAHALTLVAEIDKCLSFPLATNARSGIGIIAQARIFGRFRSERREKGIG